MSYTYPLVVPSSLVLQQDGSHVNTVDKNCLCKWSIGETQYFIAWTYMFIFREVGNHGTT